jgi:hypothetical protein
VFSVVSRSECPRIPSGLSKWNEEGAQQRNAIFGEHWNRQCLRRCVAWGTHFALPGDGIPGEFEMNYDIRFFNRFYSLAENRRKYEQLCEIEQSGSRAMLELPDQKTLQREELNNFPADEYIAELWTAGKETPSRQYLLEKDGNNRRRILRIHQMRRTRRSQPEVPPRIFAFEEKFKMYQCEFCEQLFDDIDGTSVNLPREQKGRLALAIKNGRAHQFPLRDGAPIAFEKPQVATSDFSLQSLFGAPSRRGRKQK